MENYDTSLIALDNIIVNFLSENRGYYNSKFITEKIKENYNTDFAQSVIFDRCKELVRAEILEEEFFICDTIPLKTGFYFKFNPKRKKVQTKNMNEKQYKTFDTFHDRFYISHEHKTIKAWQLGVNMYETVPKYSYKAFIKLNGELKEQSNGYDWGSFVPFIAGHRVRLGYFAWRRVLHNLIKRSIKESRKYREEQMFNERLAIAKDFERTN